MAEPDRENDEAVDKLNLALGGTSFDQNAISRKEHEPFAAPQRANEQYQLEVPREDEPQADDAPDSDSIQSEKIIDLVRTSDCTVRLMNAVNLSEKNLPVQTVQQYMQAPDYARESFLKLQNLGRKSANELDALVRECARRSKHENTQVAFERPNERAQNYQRARAVAQNIFMDLFYPDEIFELHPPVRLANLLRVERAENRVPFSDFLASYRESVQRLRSRQNCGRK